MHKTLHSNVLGYIESKKGDTTVKGWAFQIDTDVPLLEVVFESGEICVPTITERPDVVEFYSDRLPNSGRYLRCGWSFERKEPGYKIMMNIYHKWVTIFEEVPKYVITTVSSSRPSFLVVDDFYTDPDSVRSFALDQPLSLHPNNHKGIRSDNVYRFAGLKERFEQLLGTPIHGWETYGTNGCFQINVAGEQAVYHADGQTYAGVLFLTPGAPGAAGTKFYRSKSGVRKPTPANHDEVFQGGFYDSTRFEQLDAVGNVYNRLVLFDAKLIHAADTYFGKTNQDGRLIQLFFFDL